MQIDLFQSFLQSSFVSSLASSGTMIVNNKPIGITTIMTCLLFGTNFLLYILFQVIKSSIKPIDDKGEDKKSSKEKKMSKPFTGTLDCYVNLTSELFQTSLILALTYICENFWYYPHSSKHYSRDLFLFVLIIFFAYAYFTIKPIHDLTLLGREQTEEWKGWMQFIFLLYHYFHAEEVYNSVRVMITCYVWMTGFGNFSFFYIKRDFGWLRVVQMLWRLNFSCLLLMWTHGNTYILYYICPMHTFYFCMVYITMYIYQSINTTKWGIRFKLFTLGILIYIIWDINGGIFDILFAWLGTDKVIGANSGSVWEYYFRTSLDHWSTYFGMIFALNFPLAEQYFLKAKGYPLYLASILMFIATVWWLVVYYPLEKMSYNLYHSYMAIIPLTSYIFFRNLTPYLRGYVSMSLHDLGKTTLETYLLQHHIWLTSNAKTLLTIVNDSPWINFALASLLFVVVAKELYRLTMSLRGMILPEEKDIAWRNMFGVGFVVAIAYASAYLLVYSFSPSLLEVLAMCVLLTLLVLMYLNSSSNQPLNEVPYYRLWSRRAVTLLALVLVSGATLQLVYNTIDQSYADTTTASVTVINPPSSLLSSSSQSTGLVPSTTIASSSSAKTVTPECLQAISKGQWIHTPCPPSSSPSSTSSKVAFCQTSSWQWATNSALTNCPIGTITTNKLRSIFHNKKIAFIGDSQIRNIYHQFIHNLDTDYKTNYSPDLKHKDINYIVSYDDNTVNINFIWAPYLNNVTETIKSKSNEQQHYDLIVAGAACWDALVERNLPDYNNILTTNLKLVMENLNKSNTTSIWIQPTTIMDNRLMTTEKRQYMSEDIVQKYRNSFTSSNVAKLFTTIIDTSSTSTQESLDGVHYSEVVYDVIAQMVANGYALHSPEIYSTLVASSSTTSTKKPKAPYVPKTTGSMSFPSYGACVLFLSFLMIFLMDSFLGIGYLSLLVFGRSYDWDAAYSALHRKILGSSIDRNSNSSSSQLEDGNVGGGSNSSNGGNSKEEEELEGLLEMKNVSSKD